MVGSCISLFQVAWLTDTLRFVSIPGDGFWPPVVITLFAATWVYFLRKDLLFAVTLLVAPLLGNLLKYYLKIYYAVPRPEVFGCEVLTSHTGGNSFPSGHVIYYTIFFGLLTYYSWKNRAELWARILLPVAVIFILLVGYSRIYLGAHWYLDVLAGYIVGGAVLTMAFFIYNNLSAKGRGSHA